MIRASVVIVALLFAPLGANAAEEKKKEGDGAGSVGQYVDLQPVGLPIVVGGKLVNYVFVNVRINLTTTANATKLRAMEPYFRDALVRAGHRTPYTLASDYEKVDAPRVIADLSRAAARLAGPGQVRSVVVTQQMTRRRISTPAH